MPESSHPALFRRLASVDLSRRLSRARRLELGLRRLGWQISHAEIDLSAETARIELRRDDLVVIFDVRGGRASVTRERMRRRLVAVGRRGDRFLAEEICMEFVGRARFDGARTGLRWLAGYVADNAATPVLEREVRELFGGVMDGRRHVIEGNR